MRIALPPDVATPVIASKGFGLGNVLYAELAAPAGGRVRSSPKRCMVKGAKLDLSKMPVGGVTQGNPSQESKKPEF